MDCTGSSLLCELFSSCSEQGLLRSCGTQLLMAVSSLVAEHGLWLHRLQYLQHMGSVVVVPRFTGSIVVLVTLRRDIGDLWPPSSFPPAFYSQLKNTASGLSWLLSSEEPTSQFRTRVQSLIQGDLTCLGKTKPMHHNYWGFALEPGRHNYWSMRSVCTTTREEPRIQRLCPPWLQVHYFSV